jgi:alkaline phosphatase D
MVEQRTENPVVLTGDTHQNWIRNVPPDFRSLDGTPVATEVMGTSISTNGDPPTRSTVYEVPFNPHIPFRNNERGYVRCTLTPELWTSEFRKVDTVVRRPATASTLATFVIENGRAGAQRSGS